MTDLEQQPLSDSNPIDNDTDHSKEQPPKINEKVEMYAASYEIVGALLIPMLLAPLAAKSDLLMANIIGIAFLTVYAWWALLIIYLFCNANYKHSIYRIYTE
eukprot:265499_1